MTAKEPPDSQRYFPTYRMGADGIALAEYQAAADRTKSDERSLAVVNGLVVVSLVPIASTAAPILQNALAIGAEQGFSFLNLAVVLLLLLFATLVLMSYLCQLRRSYVFSARKVIVLRRLLGLSYGETTLVLPNWRIEGADNPFAVRLFPGWAIRVCYPYYTLAVIMGSLAGATFYAASPALGWEFPQVWAFHEDDNPTFSALAVGIPWAALSLLFARRELFDVHESPTLLFALALSRLLRVKVLPGIQTALYEARLARFESLRLKVDFRLLKNFAIYREDRNYQTHFGIDPKAIARAIWQRLKGNKAGGGSTITQQLVRTLFIVDLHKQIRRKIVEIIMAIWFRRLIEKNEALEIYLASVRYDAQVMGVVAALRHFFGDAATPITPSVAFILIERVSNLTSEFRGRSVRLMLQQFISAKLLTQRDAKDVLATYRVLIDSRRLHLKSAPSPEELLKEMELDRPRFD
jgi:penicillin-binding protein 1A